jgi:septum formation protein
MPELVLASGSPRRSLLLSSAGYSFRTVVPDVEERALSGENPAEMVLRLAEEKARTVPASEEEAVLAADTIVVLDGVIMGKPEDPQDALAMLQSLSGRSHSVLTGWTIVAGDEERFGVTESRVTFHNLAEAELTRYIEKTNPMDKAGAYAIQGDNGWLIESVSGSRANVMGLPIGDVADALEDLDIRRSPADRS